MTSYLEKVIWTLLKTSFTKNSFCYLLISIITIIIRIHLDALLANIFSIKYNEIFNNSIYSNIHFYACQSSNFIIRMFISCFLVINSKYLYDIVERYKPEIYKLVKYLINNYTPQNFKKWKRKINLSICIYFYLITYVIEINNANIRQTIIEYIVCYIIVDFYYNIAKGEIKIFNDKEYSCNNNDDDNIINELIKKNEPEKILYNELLDIKNE